MAKEIKDIRNFLTTARRPDAKNVKIYKSQKGQNTIIKFKIRCSRYLYTYKVEDKDKADKLKSSLPPTLKQITVPKPTSHKK